MLIVMVPLAGRVYRNTPLVIDEPHTGFRLQICVLLMRCEIVGLHNDYVIARKDSIHVTFANALMALDVVRPSLVDGGGTGFHRLARIGEHRQGLVLHSDHVPRPTCGL